MPDVVAFRRMDAFARAAACLMMGLRDFSKEEASIFFSGGKRPTTHLIETMCHRTVETKTDLVYLEFGPQIQAGPTCAHAFLSIGDDCYFIEKCGLWAPETGGATILVTLDGAPNHFVASNFGLMPRPGKAAPCLDEGLDRAASLLGMTAARIEAFLYGRARTYN